MQHDLGHAFAGTKRRAGTPAGCRHGRRGAIARGVIFRMVVETAHDSGGALTHDAATAFAGVGSGLEFYVWPVGRRPPGVQATLHADGSWQMPGRRSSPAQI